jgi:uncharacterized integral membrane protein
MGLVALLFYFNLFLFIFSNTHQVLVRLPQGVGGVPISFYIILFHFPQGGGGLVP